MATTGATGGPPTVALLAGHDELWRRATSHPFLAAVRDGTLDRAAFDTWLVQDARFVADLLAFQARLLARAPRPAQPALAAGTVALVEELGWFEELAAARGLDLAAPPLPATLAYAELLHRLDEGPYAVALTALWVLERTYLLAWRTASPAAGAYREVVEHWTTPGFAAYVDALAALADDALAAAPAGLAATVAEVLEQERAFWDMALPG